MDVIMVPAWTLFVRIRAGRYWMLCEQVPTTVHPPVYSAREPK